MGLPYDPSQVDWLAIDFVLNGTKMSLNRDTQIAILDQMFDAWTPTEAAERLRLPAKTVDTLRQSIRRQRKLEDA